MPHQQLLQTSGSPATSTDPQHHGPAEIEGFDPELPEAERAGRRINLSTVQIGASAAAAVTSALAASFFGVAGTLIGAAVGSIVSTVAGAVYTESMRRAGDRVRTTQAIVVRKVASTDAVPMLRASDRHTEVGDPATTATTSVTVPFAQVTPQTEVVPAQVAQTEVAPATTVPARTPRTPATSWWRRRPVQLTAMMLAGFLLAIGVITAAEGVLGGSLSGDRGTSTVGRVFGDTGTSTGDATPTESPSPTATPSGSATPSATSSPTSSATPGATSPASQQPVAPTANATATTTTTQPGTAAADGTPQGGSPAGQGSPATP